MYISHHVKYPLFLSDFNDNPSIGSRFVVFEQTEGRTDMTKLIVAFRDFANAPKTLIIFTFSIA